LEGRTTELDNDDLTKDTDKEDDDKEFVGQYICKDIKFIVNASAAI
jgi:hypothetical protein